MAQGSKKITLIVYSIFFASGFSALVYEVVWFRMLTRIFGNTVYATSTVLAAFMLGLALGSFLFGKWSDGMKRPLFSYSIVEAVIGMSAFLMPFAFGAATWLFVYLSHMQNSSAMLGAMRFMICFICLVVPTTMMGATFPLINRFAVKDCETLGQKISVLYGINTAGAMVGAGLAGFVLVAFLGERNTTYLAVLLNLFVAVMAFFVSRAVEIGVLTEMDTGKDVEEVLEAQDKRNNGSLIMVAVFLFGFVSLGCEVLWTRNLTLFLGTSVYAFSTILVLFLGGIAIGSFIISKYADKLKDAVFVLGGVAFCSGLAAIIIQHVFTFVGQDNSYTVLRWRGITSISDIRRFFMSAALVISAATVLFGVAFPLSLRIAIRDLKKFGGDLGRLYSANTIGAVGGPLLVGFVMIPAIGTHASTIVLSLAAIALGLVLIAYDGRIKKYATSSIILVLIAALLIFTSRDPFWTSMNTDAERNGFEIIYHSEKPGATVTLVEKNKEAASRMLFINGTHVASIAIETLLMGHLPLMMHPNPKKVLVICFGMGTAYISTLLYDVTADVVEIAPNVIDGFAKTNPFAKKVLLNEKGKVHVEDGRTYLLTDTTRYDVITIDASPPLYSAGTVNLLTADFLRIAKGRLNSGGQMMLWVPTSSATVEDFKMILATYRSVFPHVSIWGFKDGSGVLMFGSDEPILFDRDRFEMLASKKEISSSLWARTTNVADKEKNVLSLFMMDEEDTADYARGALVVTDDHPYTEFPLFRRFSDFEPMRNEFLVKSSTTKGPLVKKKGIVSRYNLNLTANK